MIPLFTVLSPALMAAMLDATGLAFIAGAAVITLPLFYLVHRTLDYCCLIHARRFCSMNRFEIVRFKSTPAFGASGVKSEFTLVELDCLDREKGRKVIRLLVWPFGILKLLSNEKYSESGDTPEI